MTYSVGNWLVFRGAEVAFNNTPGWFDYQSRPIFYWGNATVLFDWMDSNARYRTR